MLRLPDHKTRPLAISQMPKHIMYRELFCIQFASDVHYESIEIEKRRAAAVQEIRAKEDAFLKAEDAKPLQQQIAELRSKLYAANKDINMLKNHVCSNIDPRPKYPYF